MSDAATPAIYTEGLGKRYGKTVALEGLNLQVAPGEVYGFLGPNGSGKTTTIRLLLGVHRATSGRGEVFGVDAWREPQRAHQRLAYVAGEPYLWPAMTVADTLTFLGAVRGARDVAYENELIERFQLETDKKVRALSKGNRQKVQLVSAFAARPDLLLLDEPTSGLDPLMEVAFRKTVREAKARGQAVFLSSHILSEVEALCDRVGILREGRLVEQGTLDQLRHLSAETVEVVFRDTPPTLQLPENARQTHAGVHELQFDVTGEVGPLLKVLAEHEVVSLTTRKPSLEEIFLHHYQGSPVAAAGQS